MQYDPQRAIELLSEQVAALVKDNAILTSMVEVLSQQVSTHDTSRSENGLS